MRAQRRGSSMRVATCVVETVKRGAPPLAMREAQHGGFTISSLLVSSKSQPIHTQLRKKTPSIVDQFLLAQQDEYIRGVLSSSTPVGTRGSEWSQRVSSESSLRPSASSSSLGTRSRTEEVMGQHQPSKPSGSHGASSRGGSRPGTRTKAEGRLPAVRNLVRSGSSGEGLRFAQRSADALTPRTLLAAEERLNAYLDARAAADPTPAANNRNPLSSVDDESELSHAALRRLWDMPAAPLPIAPAQTVVDEQLDPLDDASALEVLQQMRACASLSDLDLLHLLRAGKRRLYPRYAVTMREGAPGNSLFIVLQGKLELSPSRLERQASTRNRQGNEAEAGSTGGACADVDTFVHPSMCFGELGLLKAMPRERSAITLECTELLVVSDAQLANMKRKSADEFRDKLRCGFVAQALKSVPFFMTLPEITQRQISELLDIAPYRRGEVVFRQGDLGDCMYIVLYGHLEVWRQMRRTQPKQLIASYTGLSPLPWFGEVFQWVTDHGRAGDVLVKEDTLMLTLSRDQVADFVFFAPGFKALSKSAATAFTIKSVKVTTKGGTEMTVVEAAERPLRYGVQWVRMVQKLIGVDSMSSVARIKVQEARRKQVNSIDWVQQLLRERDESEFMYDSDDEELPPQQLGQQVFEEQRRRLLDMAHKTRYGDSRSLASSAAEKMWRSKWRLDRSIRAELLRKASASGELAIQLEDARRTMTYKRETLPESFSFMSLRNASAAVKLSTTERLSAAGGAAGVLVQTAPSTPPPVVKRRFGVTGFPTA
jgi:CRP/FNR family cyclic AMP-dependent transcriptional regulator